MREKVQAFAIAVLRERHLFCIANANKHSIFVSSFSVDNGFQSALQVAAIRYG
jgi:hypothetical protein